MRRWLWERMRQPTSFSYFSSKILSPTSLDAFHLSLLLLFVLSLHSVCFFFFWSRLCCLLPTMITLLRCYDGMNTMLKGFSQVKKVQKNEWQALSTLDRINTEVKLYKYIFGCVVLLDGLLLCCTLKNKLSFCCCCCCNALKITS